MNLIGLLATLWLGLLLRWMARRLDRLTVWVTKKSNNLLSRVGRGPIC